jgi:hypothetical protein
MIVFYHIASFVGTLIPTKYCVIGYIGNYMRRNYTSKVYSNSIDCFLSCQLPLTFAAVVVLLDRTFSSYYKIFNFAAIILFIFLSGIISMVLHIVIIMNLKKSKTIDTEDCYPRLRKQLLSSKNEQNILLRYVNCYLFALTIPLFSSPLTLFILLCTLGF